MSGGEESLFANTFETVYMGRKGEVSVPYSAGGGGLHHSLPFPSSCASPVLFFLEGTSPKGKEVSLEV